MMMMEGEGSGSFFWKDARPLCTLHKLGRLLCLADLGEQILLIVSA